MSMTVCSSVQDIPSGFFLTDCAVSGGRLADFLQNALQAAEGRLCIRLAPVYMAFPLPCPSGIGRPLTAAELSLLHGDAPCQFSKDLCTEYFTCLQEGQAQVVLFDSLRSLREKYRIAAACGVPMVLIEDPALRRQLPG